MFQVEERMVIWSQTSKTALYFLMQDETLQDYLGGLFEIHFTKIQTPDNKESLFSEPLEKVEHKLKTSTHHKNISTVKI